jgi:hypothetical protein
MPETAFQVHNPERPYAVTYRGKAFLMYYLRKGILHETLTENSVKISMEQPPLSGTGLWQRMAGRLDAMQAVTESPISSDVTGVKSDSCA